MRGAGAVAVALVLGGSSPWMQIGYGPEHRRHNVAEAGLTLANVGSLAERWSVQVPGVTQEPVVADGRVYVATGPGVRALDEDDGTTVWDRELWAGARKAPAARSGDLLSYSGWDDFGSSSVCIGFSGSLDPADGSDVGPVTDRVSSPPVTSGSSVVQTSMSLVSPSPPLQCDPAPPLVLEVREVKTGEARWRATIPSDGSWLAAGPLFSDPTVADGRIYLNHEGVTYAFALDGCGAHTCSPIWSVTTNGPPRSPVAGPAGQVFVSAYPNLIALAGDDGSELWRADVYGELAVAGDTVFATGPQAPVTTASPRSCPT
jgi:outer membrane protein assembly factor BamB